MSQDFVILTNYLDFKGSYRPKAMEIKYILSSSDV